MGADRLEQASAFRVDPMKQVTRPSKKRYCPQIYADDEGRKEGTCVTGEIFFRPSECRDELAVALRKAGVCIPSGFILKTALRISRQARKARQGRSNHHSVFFLACLAPFARAIWLRLRRAKSFARNPIPDLGLSEMAKLQALALRVVVHFSNVQTTAVPRTRSWEISRVAPMARAR